MCDSLSATAHHLDLSKLNARFENECQQDGETVTVGPFSAFSSGTAGVPSDATDEQYEYDHLISEPSQLLPAITDPTHDVTSQSHNQNLGMFEQTMNALSSPEISSLLGFNLTVDMWPFVPATPLEGTRSTTISQQFLEDNEEGFSWNSSHELCLATEMPSFDDEHNTQLLLGHFMSKFAHRDPIWQLQAVEVQKTIGRVVLHLKPGEGNLAILNAVLAVSAYHLDRLTTLEAGVGHWWMVATAYKTKSISNLQAVLGSGLTPLDKAQYKTVLMALLTMVNVCVSLTLI